jgi:5-methylcytosine-specific restriction endonuclease McrA
MVALNVITPAAILKAIAEYDHRGPDDFLRHHGFHPARDYFLIHDGKHYDSKAIVGVAYGYQLGTTPLRAADFSGGEATVARLLRRLGFVVQVRDSPAEHSLAERVADYKRLCVRADIFWRDRTDNRAERTTADPIRSQAARDAVLLRSQGRCENPRCSGDIQDQTDSGEPILEIDHIHDLALGGPDDPAQMVALCPNCHAIKTRGRTREQLRQALLPVARARHDALIGE